MDTSDQAIIIGRRRRRRHSEEFKAECVAACRQPGVSIASVALDRRLNANLVRRWVVEAERSGKLPVRTDAAPVPDAVSFVPVSLPSSQVGTPIRIELRRGAMTVVIQWPVAAARECALLMRELMR